MHHVLGLDILCCEPTLGELERLLPHNGFVLEVVCKRGRARSAMRDRCGGNRSPSSKVGKQRGVLDDDSLLLVDVTQAVDVDVRPAASAI
jgi:hypothetical protein